MPLITNEALIEAIQKKGNLSSKAEAKRQLDLVRDTIVEMLQTGINDKGFDLKVFGLGSFKSIAVKEKSGHNPRTGESKVIPARRKIKFSFTKNLANLGK